MTDRERMERLIKQCFVTCSEGEARRHELALHIANGAGADERKFQRACGAGWTDAYQADWNVANEIYDLALAPDRPIELGTLRHIRRAQ